MQSFSTGRSEPARSTYCIGKLVCKFKLSLKERYDCKLCDSLTILNGGGNIRVIMERYSDLTAVIGINNTDLICGSKTTLGAKAASGKNKPTLALRDLNGDTGM